MLNLIKLFFALMFLTGLMLLSAAYGFKSLDLALSGAGYSMVSILILSLINCAQA